jgi:hypothetical protein
MEQSPNYKANLETQTQFSSSQLKRMNEIDQIAIAKFIGNINELETALGMLRVGYQYGWRALILIHSKTTLTKYEAILGIDIREEFPEEGPSSDRCRGIRIYKKIGKFWKIVSGEEKVPDKRVAEN